ncbi:ketopantoate reductase family protein [Amphritea sp. HPY]|uniref:ketopantoate reductase family protein n=1 Tax=Amphritea sp. HPY TaxID=3421652 RepID=UPI003D7EB645
MHWHILGAGAIGLLWAGMLNRAGFTTTLLFRNSEKLAAFQQTGKLSLTQAAHQEQDTQQYPADARLVSDPGRIDNLLLTTKAFAAVDAFNTVKPFLSADARILLLHNGMGPQEALAQQNPELNIWAGSTTDGAYQSAPYQVVQAGKGETRIGALNGNMSGLFRQLSPAIDNLIHEPDIIPVLWRKLAINCAINPLTAIFNCKNGELATNPEYRKEMAEICTEVEQVARALGITLFEKPLIEQACHVATVTARNSSSMQQDVMHRRPTEIDSITGFLCQQAAIAGIDVPANQQLLMQVRKLQPETNIQDR